MKKRSRLGLLLVNQNHHLNRTSSATITASSWKGTVYVSVQVRCYCAPSSTSSSSTTSSAHPSIASKEFPLSPEQVYPSKLLERVDKVLKWEPVSQAVDFINTHVTKYDGVFRHKQILDAVFVELKARETRQQQIDDALEECETKMWTILQGKGNPASKKEVFERLCDLREEREALAVRDYREKYERQYEHFVNEDLRFRLKMQAATWWATILSGVVWLVYSLLSWITNSDRTQEREEMKARLEEVKQRLADMENRAAQKEEQLLQFLGGTTTTTTATTQQQPQQEGATPTAQQQQQEGVTLRQQLRELVLGRVASTLRQQKDYRCQLLGGRPQRLALEQVLRREVPGSMVPQLEATMADLECGPDRYARIEDFIFQWKESEE